MTSALATLRETKGDGVGGDQHRDKLHRVLVLVQKCHGTFTVAIARRLTGWEERSLHRYIKELARLELVETVNGPRFPGKWALTQAGRDELNAPVRGDQTRLED